MASIQRRGENWQCQFMHGRRRYTFAIGKVDEAEAQAISAKVEYVLMRLKQGLMELPEGADIVEFIQRGGVLPKAQAPDISFRALSASYLKAVGDGAIESNTLDTVGIHLDHLANTLGEKFSMGSLSLSHLQRHIDRRKKDVAGVTIKKEIDTLRTVWNWAARMKTVPGGFPSIGLIYPKEEEKLPFMTWPEIERRVKAGGNPKQLWECLYLTMPELEEFLAFVKGGNAPDWFYPMILFAAHTGARRSEMIRAMAEDVDLTSAVVTIREKKRVKGRLTTRRVPLSGPLAEEMKEWMPGRISLFGTDTRARSVQGTQKAFVRALKGSKWSVMKGYHCLRHGFISALATKGIDQRLIDEWCGHSTESMRCRDRHLHPTMQAEAMKSVFG
jgi:integrase